VEYLWLEDESPKSGEGSALKESDAPDRASGKFGVYANRTQRTPGQYLYTGISEEPLMKFSIFVAYT